MTHFRYVITSPYMEYTKFENVRHLGILLYMYVAYGITCSLAASRLDMLLL